MGKKETPVMAAAFTAQLIISLGFGMIMPLLPYYAETMGASATMLGLLATTYAALQFIVSPFWGNLSDRLGRKPVLVIGLIGLGSSFFVFGIATQYWHLLAARAISGLLASAIYPTSLALVADITTSEKRARGMSFLAAGGGIGLVLGPAVGSYLGSIAIQWPFFLTAALCLLTALFVVLFVSETHRRSQSTALEAGMDFKSARDIFLVLKGPLAFLMILITLNTLAIAQVESIAALYASQRFSVGEVEMGYLFIILSACDALMQIFLVALILKRIGEKAGIQIALFGTALAMVLFAMVRNISGGYMVAGMLGITWSFLGPALNSQISRSTPADSQGKIMGISSAYSSLGGMIGPLLGGAMYDLVGMEWPFYSAAILYAIALVFTFIVFRKKN